VSARAAITVRGLRVETTAGDGVVDGVDLEVAPGSILGLVGESGSGKSTVALALLGYCQPGLRIAAGVVEVGGEDLLALPERAARSYRGRVVSYVPQDPQTALSPSQRIGDQVRRVLRRHAPERDAPETVATIFGRVGLPADAAFARRFPHQLSGGQQQRVAIAIAIACEPSVIVLDEPTTGLDVITQARILEEVRRLGRETGAAMIYVSHDLAVVAEIADRIAVMYAGRFLEHGSTPTILRQPRHPYTAGLIGAIPDHRRFTRPSGMPGVAVGVGEWPAGCVFEPRCEQRVPACAVQEPPLEAVSGDHVVRCLEWRRTPAFTRLERLDEQVERHAAPLLAVDGLVAEYGAGGARRGVLHGVSLTVDAGHSVALVGESGSGKTTLARCIIGLHAPSAGTIELEGEGLAPRARARGAEARRRIQMVFQNPYDSLNPRQPIERQIAWPARRLRGMSAAQAGEEVGRLLETLRLPDRSRSRYPHELSGGERQRVAIARALAAGPDVLVCDEITSALDVSVQAAVLDLLGELRADLGLSLLFITHDLGVVSAIADQVLVLDRGRICETGAVRAVLGAPQADYTRTLVDAAPTLQDASAGGGS
jgi:peptide/nickel transport system ATP-binding protein